MKTLHDKLPSITALETQLDAVLQAGVGEFLTATEDRREEVKGNLKFILVALGFLLAISVFLFVTNLRIQDGWLFKVVLMLALLWSTVLIIFGRAWFFNTKVLAREINMALVSIFTRTFDRQFLYTNNTDSNQQVESLVRTSSLITDKHVTVRADDSYQVYGPGDQTVAFHEVSILAAEPVSPGSRRKAESEVFRGLLVVADLPHTHSAETYISTEGNTRGLDHQSFWDDLLRTSEVKETEFKGGECMSVLHVSSSDSIAARELLTPGVLQDVHDWWQEHRLHMRLAFKGDKLYVLLPEASIRISTSTTSTKQSVIKRYAMTLARPVWRGLRLVEAVSK